MVVKDMHTDLQTKLLVIGWAVIVITSVTWILIENRLLAQEEIAKNNWQKTLSKLNAWLKDNPYKTIESPQGQWLLRVEVGAYELYLYQKVKKISATEKAYLCARHALITDSSYVENPNNKTPE